MPRVLSETIRIRVTPALKRALRRQAKRRQRKLGDHARLVLEQHVREEKDEPDGQ